MARNPPDANCLCAGLSIRSFALGAELRRANASNDSGRHAKEITQPLAALLFTIATNASSSNFSRLRATRRSSCFLYRKHPSDRPPVTTVSANHELATGNAQGSSLVDSTWSQSPPGKSREVAYHYLLHARALTK
jgi:hypothetical protein